MNFWVTALAAHASDMSSWIFLGYPAALYTTGLNNIWMAIGLLLFMFLNWQFVAIPLRKMTQNFESLTLSSFFESRFSDTDGVLRILTVLIALVFYTIYIASGLVGLALLLKYLLHISFNQGLIVGALLIIPYLLIGGYITLAWTDFFQGLFLMCVILFVPLWAIYSLGGWNQVLQAYITKPDLTPFIPQNLTTQSVLETFFMTCSMGLAYFGQPHIITKFMGIKNPQELKKAKYVGLLWQFLSLFGATLIAFASFAFFTKTQNQSATIFLQIVQSLFNPFIGAFILCAVLGATITCADSQILVIASNFSEDIYKKVLRKNASSKELILVSRLCIILIAIISLIIAYNTTSSIFSLVNYAFNGLGSAFGPLILFALYVKKTNKKSALLGILVGAFVPFVWPFIQPYLSMQIAPIIPGFFLSSLAIWCQNFFNPIEKLYDI